jgi:hypothetical protein
VTITATIDASGVKLECPWCAGRGAVPTGGFGEDEGLNACGTCGGRGCVGADALTAGERRALARLLRKAANGLETGTQKRYCSKKGA